MRVAVVQLNSRNDRKSNVDNALRLVDEAAKQGARFVLLPEYATFVGGYDDYPVNAESVPGQPPAEWPSRPKRHGIYLHAGSLIETAPSPEPLLQHLRALQSIG